jgi:hypothetical protein
MRIIDTQDINKIAEILGIESKIPPSFTMSFKEVNALNDIMLSNNADDKNLNATIEVVQTGISNAIKVRVGGIEYDITDYDRW